MKKNILLRIDEELWKELREWANEEKRSLNNLLEFLLLKILEKKEKEINGIEAEDFINTK